MSQWWSMTGFVVPLSCFFLSAKTIGLQCESSKRRKTTPYAVGKLQSITSVNTAAKSTDFLHFLTAPVLAALASIHPVELQLRKKLRTTKPLLMVAFAVPPFLFSTLAKHYRDP
ncbi:putative GTP-binding protein EngB [Trichinella pseudospiralis]